MEFDLKKKKGSVTAFGTTIHCGTKDEQAHHVCDYSANSTLSKLMCRFFFKKKIMAVKKDVRYTLFTNGDCIEHMYLVIVLVI